MGGYEKADVTAFIQKGDNTIEFITSEKGVVGEIEILLLNGERIIWNTDATWLSEMNNQPVKILLEQKKPLAFAPEEHLAIYEVKAPVPACGDEETRMYISYKGDVANAYLNGKLVADSFYDGTDWIISLNRLKETINFNPLVIRIGGLKSVNEQIYFEKNVDPAECVTPVLSDIQVNQEYRFEIVVD